MKIKNKREIFIFILLTYLFSWSIWGIGYSIYTHNNNLSLFALIAFIGTCMPSLIGIILTLYFYKTKGLKDFFKRLNIFKKHALYCIIGIIAITIYVVSSFVFAKYIGFNENFKINFPTLLSNFLSILLIGGPLEEELGWRGFLLDKIHSNFNVCISSIFMGIIWSLWHLPLLFIPGSSQYNFPLSVFILQSIFLSIIMTVVFDKTNQCITFAIILHAVSNALFTTIASSFSSMNTYILFIKDNQFIISTVFVLVILSFTIIEFIMSAMRNKA